MSNRVIRQNIYQCQMQLTCSSGLQGRWPDLQCIALRTTTTAEWCLWDYTSTCWCVARTSDWFRNLWMATTHQILLSDCLLDAIDFLLISAVNTQIHTAPATTPTMIKNKNSITVTFRQQTWVVRKNEMDDGSIYHCVHVAKFAFTHKCHTLHKH